MVDQPAFAGFSGWIIRVGQKQAMATPKATVVITTYNRAATLRDRSVASVRKQTYQDWECIVVDDGSSDDTEAVMQSLIKEDPRIRYFKKENDGMSAERNFGVRQSRGEYIAFLDDDDEFLPNYLERLMDTFETLSPEYACIAPVSIVRDYQGRETEVYNELEPFWKYSIGSCCCFKRAVFFDHDVFFDEKLQSFEDDDFHIQFHFSGQKLYRLWEPLVICTIGLKRKSGNSVSANHSRQRRCFDDFLKKNGRIYEEQGKEAVAWLYSFGGWLYLADGKMKEGRRMLWTSFRAQPTVLPAVYILASFFGPRFFAVFLNFKTSAMRFLRVHLLVDRAPKEPKLQ